jgi:hypothetical protein
MFLSFHYSVLMRDDVHVRFISIPSAVIAFLLLYTLPSWHEENDSDIGSEREVKPFPIRQVTQIILASLTVSSIVALLASFWQHMAGAAASTMAEVFTYGAASGDVGAGALVLGWLSFSLLTIACAGTLVMVMSIRVLAQMV